MIQFHLNHRKHCLMGSETPEHVFQRGAEVSIYGDIQNPPRQGPEQPILAALPQLGFGFPISNDL